MSEKHTYRYVTDWKQLDAETGDAIRAFWTRENANVEGEEALRRVQQVVLHVVDENDEIAAVATATPKVLPRLGQPLYYYRCFVGKAWRSGRLVRPLMRRTQRVLEDYAREHDFPCIGVLLELENAGFATALQWAHWNSTGFSYIGKSPRGLDLRVCYFRGARLKTPAEVQALVQEHMQNAA
ncbi:MAG TPA: hypothetical protein VF217_07135 [Rhodanobacteraceae bacterium]|jgi:hypothetical protein